MATPPPSSKSKARLSHEDWLAAGFRALSRSGPKALKVEPLARELGTTKGSFYWHFKDLPAFRTAMLMLWRSRATEEIISELQTLPSGLPRLEALITRASSAPDRFGGHRAEPAIRDWARHDHEAKAVLTEVDAKRLTFLEQEFRVLGITDPTRAHVFYAAHLGLELLAEGAPQTGEQARRQLLHLLAPQAVIHS